MARLRGGLKVPDSYHGSSVLGPSLKRAQLLAKEHDKCRTTLVVLSDFLLFDTEPILLELAAFPGDVHAVVLGSAVPMGLKVEPIRVTAIKRGDPPGAVARAVFASLLTHRVHAD